jgi:hypothetical protein
MLYAELKGMKLYPEKEGRDIFWNYYTKPNKDGFWCDSDIPRDDPALIKVVKQLGEKAGGAYSVLKIVKIPADVKWKIEEHDGNEWVSEKHRTWS